jgi:hypothetical protein
MYECAIFVILSGARKLAFSASVVSQKFVEQVPGLFRVIPAKAGIQTFLKFLDSGSR